MISPEVPSAFVPFICTNIHLLAVVLGSTVPLITTLPLVCSSKGIVISAAAVDDVSVNFQESVAALYTTETPLPVSEASSDKKPVSASPIATGVETVVVSVTSSVVVSVVASVVVVVVDTVVCTVPPVVVPPTDTRVG